MTTREPSTPDVAAAPAANAASAPTVAALLSAGILRDLDGLLVDSLARTYGVTLDEHLRVLLAFASRVSGDGHICLDLSASSAALPDALLPDARASLAQCSLVSVESPGGSEPPPSGGTAAAPAPFVLSGSRLYLRRFWNYEQQVARRLRALADLPPEPIAPAEAAAIDALPADVLADEQRAALRLALERRLVILTGGPGTGKTTIAAHLLRLLARRSTPPCIRAAAPTGKAAARIDEALDALLGPDAPAREKACTIERLLGWRRASPYFRHNAANPLRADLVLLDETSMMDLPRFAKLLDALPPRVRLVLLGDKDQLASVDPGSVMAELCASAALAPCIATLATSHRFPPGSPVARLASAINAGDADRALECAGASPGLLPRGDSAAFKPRALPAAFESQIRVGYAPLLAATTPADALAALDRYRVLCALRLGPFGILAVNRAIENLLLPRRRSEFYKFRPVLVTRNDYETSLFNGDIGIAWDDGSVHFRAAPGAAGPAASATCAVPAHLLPEHETAFAMTVHKAQGSGFDRILLLLPDKPAPVLTRELLYTAVTRTRTGIDLWLESDTFARAVRTPVARHAGLRDAIDSIPPPRK